MGGALSTYVEIFLRPLEARSTREVVDDLSTLTAVPLVREPKYDDEAYVGVREGIAVELFVDHGYEDDDDMPFGSHPFMLRFRTLARDVDGARAYLERVYSALKATQRYSLFATYDLQYPLSKDVKT